MKFFPRIKFHQCLSDSECWKQTWKLKRAYILTATKSTWNKFSHEGMNVYTLPADGNYYGKRIFHHALTTETNRVMMSMALWKKMLLKSAGNFDSGPWLLTHLSVLNFMKGNWNSISVDLSNKTASARICLHALATKNDVDGIVKEK